MRTVEEWKKISSKITAGYIPDKGKEYIYENGLLYANKYIFPYIPITNNMEIFDIGCGNGRLAMPLSQYNIRYTGMDIIRPCIEFCRSAFSVFPNFSFYHMDVYNGHYNVGGTVQAKDVWFDFVKSGSMDLVICSSLFTHMYPEEGVVQYLEEIYRTLKPGGILISTWLRSPPNEVHMGEDRTVYPEYLIVNFLKKFTWILSLEGRETRRGYQWYIYARK